eukprot:2899742-Rhodomonas_salina.1
MQVARTVPPPHRMHRQERDTKGTCGSGGFPKSELLHACKVHVKICPGPVRQHQTDRGTVPEPHLDPLNLVERCSFDLERQSVCAGENIESVNVKTSFMDVLPRPDQICVPLLRTDTVQSRKKTYQKQSESGQLGLFRRAHGENVKALKGISDFPDFVIRVLESDDHGRRGRSVQATADNQRIALLAPGGCGVVVLNPRAKEEAEEAPNADFGTMSMRNTSRSTSHSYHSTLPPFSNMSQLALAADIPFQPGCNITFQFAVRMQA